MYLLFGCLHIGQAKGVSGLSINILCECDKLSVQRGFFKYSAGAHPKASGQVAGWPLYLENQEIPGNTWNLFTPGKAPGKLNFRGNTPGNTWKNVFLL